MQALLIIDAQNDFMPGGPLGVAGADEIIPRINRLIGQFSIVAATQDWHPPEHGSFAANHAGAEVFQQSTLGGLPQTLWPTHCVQNTRGACFAPGLDTAKITKIFTKGENPEIDSYSGFFDNGRRAATGLHAWLQEQKITHLTVAGVATDFCVKYTVLDALSLGYKVSVVVDACRGVHMNPADSQDALSAMQAAGTILC
jgi:nicotinamidase/pyrazinamidase